MLSSGHRIFPLIPEFQDTVVLYYICHNEPSGGKLMGNE